MYIRNPVEWSLDQLKFAGTTLETLIAGQGTQEDLRSPPTVRHIRAVDVREALAKGFDDFAAFRTDVALTCVIYPIVGLLLARLAFGYEMLPLIFPI